MSDVENQVVEPASDWVIDSTEPVEPVEVAAQDETAEVADEADSDELELVIDGEAVPPTADEDEIEMPEDAPNWARDLRQKYKELARENKQLKQVTPQPQPQQEPDLQELPEPTLEGCDWDEAKFKADMKAWAAHQAKLESAKAERESKHAKEVEAIQAKQAAYVQRKAEIAKHAPDYDSVEQVVTSALTVQTQNMILDLAKDPTAIVLAAGRNKALLNELAGLQTDPIRLAAKIGELNRTANFAPKVKQGFGAEPKVRAPSIKPQSAEDAAFSARFPDAKFT